MRLRLGRPDIARYAERFDVPPARSDFAVTFLGVSTLLLADGESAFITDGFFSRPSLARVGLGRIAPDLDRIDQALARTGVGRLAGVVPVHTHFDHAMDSAVVAERTGALLVGGRPRRTSGEGMGFATSSSGSSALASRWNWGTSHSRGSSPTTAHPTATPDRSPNR